MSQRSLAFARGIELPIEAITESIALMGRKGSGKTYGAQKLFEVMYGVGAQTVAVDPVGNWYGLRKAADGKGKGLDVPVFGGDHGDIPLSIESGRVIAKLVVERRLSVILDVSSFRKAELKRFMAAFAEELFQLKKTHRKPMHLFLEEARLFVPQNPAPDEAHMLGAIEDIVRRGRNYGIGCSLLDQRPQSVNKNVLSQTEILIVLQLVGAHERKAIEDWVKAKDELAADKLELMSGLHQGECIIYSPGLLRGVFHTKILKKHTFDASATPTFDEEDVGDVEPLKSTEMEELRNWMAEAGEDVDADDPNFLKKRIAELEARPAARQVPVQVIDPKAVERLKTSVADLDDFVVGLDGKLGNVAKEVRALRDALERAEGFAKVPIDKKLTDLMGHHPTPRNGAHKPVKTGLEATFESMPHITKADATPHVDVGGVKLELGAREILVALRSFHPDLMSKVQIATFAGYKASGGSFGNYLSKLKVNGLIEKEGDQWKLTLEGLRVAPPAARPRSRDELLELWCSKLTGHGRAKDILRLLVTLGPSQGLLKHQIASEVGMDPGGGSFGNYLSILRTNQLVKKKGAFFYASPDFYRN